MRENEFFKNINIIRDKERLRRFSELKDTKGTWQLNTISDFRLDSVLKEKVLRKIIEASDKFGVQTVG